MGTHSRKLLNKTMKDLKIIIEELTEVIDMFPGSSWEETHPQIIEYFRNQNINVSELVDEEITMHYFNAKKITTTKLEDFLLNYTYDSYSIEDQDFEEEKYHQVKSRFDNYYEDDSF